MSMARVVLAACALMCVCAVAVEGKVKAAPAPYPFKPGFPYALPTTVVNLDLPPQLKQMHVRAASLLAICFPPQDWQVPAAVRPVVEAITAAAEDVLNADLVNEIKGVYDTLKQYAPPGVKFDLSMVMAMNVMYEFSAACTSVVAQDAQGNIWHGRNLDWGVPSGVDFSNFTYLVSFQSGGQEVYSGVNFIGYVGSLTVMRNGAFAITIDERNPPKAIDQLLANLYRMEKGYTPITWMARLVAQNNESFADALTALTYNDVAAPAYYIISGKTGAEGCVLARQWNETVNGAWCIPNGPQPWYVFETNYDHWEPAPKGDDRRATATEALNSVGQAGMGATGMYTVMTTAEGTNGTRGVLNSMTLYTVVMQPSTSHFGAWNMN